MYQDYHQLKLPPFDVAPDPRFFYASNDHRESLAAIEYTIRNRKGMVMVTGDVGSGKTTVSRTLQQRMMDSATIVSINSVPETGRQLLRSICRALRIELSTLADRGEMIDAIETRVTALEERDRPLVLIVDEAQMLCDAVFEEIRLLSNIESRNSKLVQTVLIGQTELAAQLNRPRLAGLRQRIVLAHHLRPLSTEDTAHYLAHRLTVASAHDTARVRFDQNASAAVFRISGGVPRLINVLADNCLLIAFVRCTRTIDRSIVEAAAHDLLGTDTQQPIIADLHEEPLLKAA